MGEASDADDVIANNIGALSNPHLPMGFILVTA